MSQGQNANIGINFQNSYGTLQTNSMYWLAHITDGLALGIEQLMSESNRGVNDTGESYEGIKSVEGDLELEALPLSLGVVFKALMGDPITVSSGTLRTHTFQPRIAGADFDRFSTNIPITYHQYLDTGSAQLFYDLNASTLDLSVANGELLKMTVGFVGGSFEQLANIAATYNEGEHFTWDASSISIGNIAVDEIVDLSVSIDESIEAQHTLNGSKYPSRVKRTDLRTIEVSGTLKFETQDQYQEFLSQSQRELIATFVGPTQIQSGYNEQLTITIPALRYTEIKPTAGSPGEQEVGFTGSAKYHTGSATAISFELRNTQPAY